MVRTKVFAICGLASLTMFLGSGGASAQAMAHETCPIEMYNRADSSLVDERGSWPSLLKHQRAFASCDDGALAEGYSDSVVTLFAHQWDQFRVFVALSKQDPAVERWAIRHIDATTSDDDLKKIVLNAATCTDDLKAQSLCKAIRQAAAGALKEIDATAR